MSDSALPPVSLADPRAENAQLREALLATMTSVLDGGQYILGPQVSAFERAFAEHHQAHGAVGVASGTDALVVALVAAGVGPGSEVIAPSFTAGPTVAAIRMAGATPVLVEVEAETYGIDPAAVAEAVGPATKAVIAVHLYGHPANLDALTALTKDKGIALIEDCAQSVAARWNNRPVGSFGAYGCFSFYPTKNLGAIGDGGAITVPDTETEKRVRSLRAYGWDKPQYAEIRNGRCSRLDELQAALLAVKLPHLEAWTNRRRAIAARYREGLAGLPLVVPVEKPQAHHVYHLFVIRSQNRDALETHLAGKGIRTGRHYPFPVHVQPGLAEGARIPRPLMLTETLTGEILSLPMHAAMSMDDADQVIAAVRSFF